jgi:hypothetical protein
VIFFVTITMAMAIIRRINFLFPRLIVGGKKRVTVSMGLQLRSSVCAFFAPCGPNAEQQYQVKDIKSTKAEVYQTAGHSLLSY